MMKFIQPMLFASVVLLLVSCKKKISEAGENGIFSEAGPEKTGITFANELKDSPVFNIIEYLYYYNGSGVAVGDVNGDGLEDIYFGANMAGDRLYINKGGLKFEDVTPKAGIISDNTWTTGVAMDDINSDGYLDIYVCKVSKTDDSHNLVYLNDGKGKFTESSASLGLDFSGLSTQASFFDYDRDGDLDLYLLNHNIHNVHSYGNTDNRRLRDTIAGDVLFENRIKEEGRFVDVTLKAGIYSSPLGYGLGLATADVNNDGWTDIYVGNDFHENDYLYLNNGNGTFTESISSAMAHTSQFSMGIDIADANNDGLMDIFTTDMMPYLPEVALVSGGEDSDQIKKVKKDFGFRLQNARNHFNINRGDGTYSDIAYLTGTFATDWSWSVLMQDFDHDMFADIFVANGIVKRPNDLDYINFLNELDNKDPNAVPDRTKKLIEKMPSQPLSNVLFRHNGEMSYSGLQNSFVGKPSFSTGAAYADLDKDGDLDIVLNNINQNASILENRTATGNYVSLSLKGIDGMTAKGSRVELFTSQNCLVRELQTCRGFMSSSTHDLFFGLPKGAKVDSVRIVWPDRKMQVLHDVTAGGHNTIIRQKDDTVLKPYVWKAEVSDFTVTILPAKHDENNYFDENNEKLIPERLSYEGPALICEDLDGDGIKDIFMGGGRNQAARIMTGQKDGTFKVRPVPDFVRDAGFEDVAAATIDFDGDGDRDIYVVSGGSDNKELDKLLEDRIYLNNGNGIFKRIPLSLPHTNGSTVAVADFNRDGFEDIFVGARSIPGFYGLSPYSFILRNVNGQAVDIYAKDRFGMITDAEWVDLENDGDADLVMCGDWMGIIILENDGKGNLLQKNTSPPVEQRYGMWNCLAFYDFNLDGKQDILAGNMGLNQKWTASDSLPVKLYTGDFDQNGFTEPLIFTHYFTRYMPFLSRDKLVAQLPVLKKKFTSYTSFKDVARLEDLDTKFAEKAVETKTVTDLRSGIFLSTASGYDFVPLALDDQLSAINDIYVTPAGQVVYVGNYRQYVSDMGASMANSGRMLSDWDQSNKKFKKGVRLPISVDMDPRRISALSNSRLIVACNNGDLLSIMIPATTSEKKVQ